MSQSSLSSAALAAHFGGSVPTFSVTYETESVGKLVGQRDVLAVIGFGTTHAVFTPQHCESDPRLIRVGLDQSTGESSRFEVWRTAGVVETGRTGALRHAGDGHHGFVCVEVEEFSHGGLAGAAETAYRELLAHVEGSNTPHVLRLWNYFDAINSGEGDEERYRQFCSGRARGVADHFPDGYPAATAIGRRDGARTLQVYGLTSRTPGHLVENPRQVSAWRYPREYGPVAPVFARAMREANGSLLISGTAAVVGHASRHPGDIDAQLDETLANLDSLLLAGHGDEAHFGNGSLLKVYVRNPDDRQRITAILRERLPDVDGLLLLDGDICRRDLLVEIDGIHA